ncbi:MAG: reverse transcriptase N-terminal domain-containing protein [Pseudomonadota bacterium]
MNILWKYPFPDRVFEFQGGSLPQKWPSYLMTNEAIMKDWDWDTIIWKKVRQLVFNLQKRIYKATKSGKYSGALMA